MSGLPLLETERLRNRMTGPFELQGPFLGRDLRVNSERIRLSGTTVSGGPRGRLIGGVGAGLPIPRASYQWLLFEEISGSVPVGPTTFIFEGDPIPFIGAITEVDVIATDPVNDWQMRISLEGYGSIFKTTQSAITLTEAGFFRPTPPGFWPETEGLVVPIDASGRRPLIEVFREGSVAPNLTLRVLIVAHPSF